MCATTIDGSLERPRLEEDEIKKHCPKLWAYLEEGKAQGIPERYLCRHRTPWYSQENRPPAPFVRCEGQTPPLLISGEMRSGGVQYWCDPHSDTRDFWKRCRSDRHRFLVGLHLYGDGSGFPVIDHRTPFEKSSSDERSVYLFASG